ncbi:hypothetical protein RQP46_000566 [Phenoliferia psychrophenolica]
MSFVGGALLSLGQAKKSALVEARARKATNKVVTPHPLDAEEYAARTGFSVVPMAASSRPSGVQRYKTVEEKEKDDSKAARFKLESRFLRLPLELLHHHRVISATAPLTRPIPEAMGVLRVTEFQPEELEGLSCPKRPKWHYTSSKLEVERNEEGVFSQWLKSTDDLLGSFSSSLRSTPAPTFFERNLQVWRQLWRVSEASSILLILIDVRFPLIHYPPSLEAYVKGLRGKKVILVLTKTDLVPRWLSEAWQKWFEEREGPEGASVVLMESYRETERSSLTQGTQPRFVPAAPTSSRQSLLSALRKAHKQLLTPPPIVANFPERLAKWKPQVRSQVDWDSVVEEDKTMTAKERKKRRGTEKEYVEREGEGEGEPGEEEEINERPWEGLEGDDAFPFLTVGLIGQPNVGKSSLLNALLGRKVVRASRTPGKTKTLQTIFWNSTVRLCDCPGLVCPSFAGMERQVLSGILPIQNVEPVLYFIAQRMPLEDILKLRHPDFIPTSVDDQPVWTSDDLLSTYATAQGFITAKAGRPDLYRAGAFILRQLHSSSIPWAFRPPFEGDATAQDQIGIFIPGFEAKASNAERERREKALVEGEESRSEDETESEEEEVEESEGEESESEESESGAANSGALTAIRSAFTALEVEEGTDDEEEEDEK